MPVLNIAAYRFAPLEGDLMPLRNRLRTEARTLGLRGTILLSGEGINLFLAGAEDSVRAMLESIRAIPGFAELEAKESWSESAPFRRMLVRIKREIIAFGVPGIDPARAPAPRISARELEQWLNDGKPVTLLDTRNDYEVRLGTFRGAVVPPLRHFRDFPRAAAALPQELRNGPVVTFCTGGIRCEKAAPFLLHNGFREVYQLDGGILKYFEETGGTHFSGECFVFDHRVGLDPALAETETAPCFVCQASLTPLDQESPQYQPGVSCPFCYRDPQEQQAERIAAREAQFRRAATPLPGSIPYDNFRPVTVPGKFDRFPLLAFLTQSLPGRPESFWRNVVDQGDLLDPGFLPATKDRIVRSGERYRQRIRMTVEPAVNADLRVLYEDDAIVVLDKPAPLPMHPGGRFHRNTLQFLLEAAYRPGKPRPAHRLDANTSGLVLVSRTRRIAAILQTAFANREIGKSYLVKVSGHPDHDSFRCELPLTVVPGPAGTRAIQTDGQSGLPAETGFVVLDRHADGTALLEAIPVTGRTNQIRLHCQALGYPVSGDPVYGASPGMSRTQTMSTDDPPMCLHAWKLSFQHPVSGVRMDLQSPLPSWARRWQTKAPGE